VKAEHNLKIIHQTDQVTVFFQETTPDILVVSEQSVKEYITK
jgi:hypothetical protein